MSRSVPEWVGKTDDTKVPPRVRLRVFDREGGRCHLCTRLIRAGERWTLEHRIALINGGRNAESNLCCTCCNCLPEKNAADIAEKTDVSHKRAKHIGTHRAKRPLRSRNTFRPAPSNARDINADLEEAT